MLGAKGRDKTVSQGLGTIHLRIERGTGEIERRRRASERCGKKKAHERHSIDHGLGTSARNGGVINRTKKRI